MKINKDDLPYLYENTSPWKTLSNGVEQQVIWEYTIDETAQLEIEGSSWYSLLERVRRKQCFRFAGYTLTTSSVHEWQYMDNPDASYAGVVRGYRGYWDGAVMFKDSAALQPEVAVVLGLTPDPTQIPPFIETVSLADLQELMDLAQKKYADDDAVAFPKPVPIEVPKDAPDSIRDAMRRMRAQSGLKTTRGRAVLIEWLLEITGTTVADGGWALTNEEFARRQRLGLR